MTHTQERTWYVLRELADQADTDYIETLARHTGRRDRWSITRAQRSHPEVQAALQRKVQADDALVAYMQIVGTHGQ